MDKLILNSYAKLNLYLEVLGIRKDNYHNLRTVFERIDLSDKIVLSPRRDKKIKIICKNPSVPLGNSNLCYRSARLLQETFDLSYGLNIEIIKRIPVGAGLGGGSGNAAAVLLGLNRLWKLGLPLNKLVYLAQKIGCDVPFFIYNVPFAYASERGDKIKPLDKFKNRRLWHILVLPNLAVSTPLIYKEWDRMKADLLALTKSNYKIKILILALKENRVYLKSGLLSNSLEKATIKLYPEVGCIKEKLIGLGVQSVLMSGSGPAVFGVVSSRKEAVFIAKQLEKEERSWQVFVARTR